MKKILVAASVLVAAFSLRASLDGYFMLAGCSQGQLPSPAYTIYGGRLSMIYGDCHEFYGLDVGIAGTVQESAYGLSVNAVWSGVDADMYGAQVGGLMNTVKGSVFGLQSGVYNWSGELFGCQIGLINLSDDCYGTQIGVYNGSYNLYGTQIGYWNMADDSYGCQCGVVNVANDVYGCQIGVFNYARKLYGCQIGWADVQTACMLPVLPILHLGW